MTKLKHFINLMFTKKFISKFAAYFLLIIIFYVLGDFIGIFLLTFIFAYLFFTLAEFIKFKLDITLAKFTKNKKIIKFFDKIFGLNFIIITLYIFFIGAIIFIVSDLIPKLVNELSGLPTNIPFLAEPISSVTTKLVEIKNFNAEIGGSISEIVTNQDMAVVMDILSKLKSASVVLLQIMISIILSFVFLIDRFKLKVYLLGIKKSNFSFFYKEYKIIFEKIVKSFGLIFKAQAMIAFINSILTIIGLIVIGLIHGGSFPYILTLGLIVFIAGFIPVLGVFLSSIPILIIAYSTIGGYSVILEILLLISIIHLIEAYYLNPKIVSRFLEIPVSVTFIILIVSEHLFGIAGLLIGVSLFYFIVGLLRDIEKVLEKNKKEIKKIKKDNKEQIELDNKEQIEINNSKKNRTIKKYGENLKT